MDFKLNGISDDEQMQDILAECYNDPRKFARLLFPETYFKKFSYLHDKIFEPILAREPRIVIVGGRSIGKTSIARLLAMHTILFREARFLCYLGLSATFAEMQTENIKMELTSNAAVKAVFGDISTNYYDTGSGIDMQFSKKSWVANGYGLILPRGAGQQVRGLNWLRYRPDFFVIDDLEDKLTIDNPDIRKKTKEWFFDDVMKAKAISGGTQIDPRFIYIDTLKHYDALIRDLMESPDWAVVSVPICSKQYVSLMPDFKPQVDLDRELAEHRRLHMLDSFHREFMCEPIAGEAKAFKQEYFKYYEERDGNREDGFQSQLHDCITVLIVDPAKTVKMNSAQSAFVIWSVNLKTNRMYVRYACGEFYHPDELYDAMFRLAREFSCDLIAIEETSLNEFIKQPILNELSRRGENYPIMWLNPRRDKRDDIKGEISGKAGRVAALVPYYRQGLVYHNVVDTGDLETQLMSFPVPKRWDVMDAAAYIIPVMQEADLFMAMQQDPDKPDEAIYDTIESDSALMGWRIV